MNSPSSLNSKRQSSDASTREHPMKYRPKLDPKVDLVGATPETLARALFRCVVPLRPGARRKSVVRDQVAVQETPADEPGDGIPHLRKRP